MDTKPTSLVCDTKSKLDGDLEKSPHHETEAETASVQEGVMDLFSCFPTIEGIEPEENPLTVRAVLTGIVLGSVVNASNVYLGLKTGFNFPATIFGAIFGYGFILMLTKLLPNVPGLGSRFGPQENCIIQAAATGAGGISSVFIAALPAMYRLNLLSDDPKSDFGRILTITMVCASFGLFASVPLRKFFIINVSRELNLVFPTCTATAMTIRSMHGAGSGAADAMKKIKGLAYAFSGAFIHIITSQYADGILHNWHLFNWFYIWSSHSNQTLLSIDNWGWYIQLSPAFFGTGILVGPNPAFSWFFGSVVAWGLVGPLLVHYGECVGAPIGTPGGIWEHRVTYNALAQIGAEGWVSSPRYWFLWPGVMVLLVYSLAEFLLHIRVVYDGAVYAFRDTSDKLNRRLQARGKRVGFLERQARKHAEAVTNYIEDFAPRDQLVSPPVWITGTVAALVLACIVCELQFDMNPGLAILACILGLVFAFLSIYGAAVTDIAPLTASAKASQLIYGGITHGQEASHAQRINLIAGAIASGTADVATHLVADFRVGFLLRTPPKLQFYAQAIGTAVAVFLAPGIFVLFASAYPCIWNTSLAGASCPFAAPSVSAWVAVAQAVTLPSIPIPRSSGIFAIVMGVVCAIQVVGKTYYLVGERQKYRKWLPNWMAIGIAWVLGADCGYVNIVLFGCITGWWWRRYFADHFEMFGLSIAAGLMAGEGLAGVVNAALQLGEVSGAFYGTKVGLPGF
ncbi:hypothetical protein QWA68_015256 [Fusarium oxysporum]|nr:hypothetical protein QWA68_015256 [Fusarium oxysporum]